ncbi:uncharacterized protein LOC130276920 isoform X2 [Hyla sarda]|uniref:uncharacterized protein LOC130276920 isoform X2 n=1 Tax=Hyla sarda TaxID=327740 RepID=UPI0024C22568|nr:uncharacterized protein LOC130276920 isoform X2 [Hyla sarda]
MRRQIFVVFSEPAHACPRRRGRTCWQAEAHGDVKGGTWFPTCFSSLYSIAEQEFACVPFENPMGKIKLKAQLRIEEIKSA